MRCASAGESSTPARPRKVATDPVRDRPNYHNIILTESYQLRVSICLFGEVCVPDLAFKKVVGLFFAVAGWGLGISQFKG